MATKRSGGKALTVIFILWALAMTAAIVISRKLSPSLQSEPAKVPGNVSAASLATPCGAAHLYNEGLPPDLQQVPNECEVGKKGLAEYWKKVKVWQDSQKKLKKPKS